MIKLECSVADPIKYGDAIIDAIEEEMKMGQSNGTSKLGIGTEIKSAIMTVCHGCCHLLSQVQ